MDIACKNAFFFNFLLNISEETWEMTKRRKEAIRKVLI